jgi:hypothetical protein
VHRARGPACLIEKPNERFARIERSSWLTDRSRPNRVR